MMTTRELVGRKRNSAATRANLLAAATAHFAREDYDNASLRDIAADAGVDVALISRYFGSKEELFSEVLSTGRPPEVLFEGDPSDFGERVSRILIDDPLENDKLDILLVLLRSSSSPAAVEAIRRSSEERFYGPFARWLGGPNVKERVRLAAGIITGIIIARKFEDDLGLTPKERKRLRARLARTLQSAIEP